ncbi:MAG: MFS transporter [Candidatus Saccharimonadales bacterium]
MKLPDSARIIRTYLTLQFGNTLAASMIWGINTLFLLNAGLTNFEAFLANAFFTLGMVLFEIPTGIVADSRGRRMSYLLGTVTLGLSTLLYYLLWTVHAPLWQWAGASLLLGLGFTFFSGAVEAWLVDALESANFTGHLESVFGRAQVVNGIAMLVGTLGGGALAQFTNLGVPYIVRGVILLLLFMVAWRLMHDEGFTPERTETPLVAMRSLLKGSVDNGLRVPAVRWLMLSAVLLSSVGFYVFYALQPYLLQLYGDTSAYMMAGLAATLVAAAQMTGGFLAGKIRGLFQRRTSALLLLAGISSLVLGLLWLTSSFYAALVLVFVWGFVFAAVMPIRQSYLNGMIPKAQRATVLSFDSMLSNTGGVAVQPALARAADVWSYGASFAIGAVLQVCALPMIVRSRSFCHPSDRTKREK